MAGSTDKLRVFGVRQSHAQPTQSHGPASHPVMPPAHPHLLLSLVTSLIVPIILSLIPFLALLSPVLPVVLLLLQLLLLRVADHVADNNGTPKCLHYGGMPWLVGCAAGCSEIRMSDLRGPDTDYSLPRTGCWAGTQTNECCQLRVLHPVMLAGCDERI